MYPYFLSCSLSLVTEDWRKDLICCLNGIKSSEEILLSIPTLLPCLCWECISSNLLRIIWYKIILTKIRGGGSMRYLYHSVICLISYILFNTGWRAGHWEKDSWGNRWWKVEKDKYRTSKSLEGGIIMDGTKGLMSRREGILDSKI